jgi:hypothetical protein
MDQTCVNLSSTSSTFAVSSSSSKCSQMLPTLSSVSPSNTSLSPILQNRGSNCPKCNFCSHLGYIEAKSFLKEKLIHQIPLSPSLTASPASITTQSTSQAVSNAPQSASITLASALFSNATSDTHISSWVADTGASAHMMFSRH